MNDGNKERKGPTEAELQDMINRGAGTLGTRAGGPGAGQRRPVPTGSPGR